MVDKIEELIKPHSRNKKRAPIAVTHPHLTSEWVFEKNCGFTPTDFTACSSIKAWWRCSKNPDHLWQTKINYRTKGHGCPFCAGKSVDTARSLASTYPDISADWHPVRNDFGPDEVMPKSRKIVWWLCHICGNEWKTRIVTRTDDHAGCFKCKLNVIDLTKPEYAYCLEYFDKKKNKGAPVWVTTRTKVYWRCPKNPDHAWQSKVRKPKKRSTFCPFCWGSKLTAKQKSKARRLFGKGVRKTDIALAIGCRVSAIYSLQNRES
jgi:hypothetical protein